MKKKYPFLQLVTTVPKQYKILKPFKNFEPNITNTLFVKVINFRLSNTTLFLNLKILTAPNSFLKCTIFKFKPKHLKQFALNQEIYIHGKVTQHEIYGTQIINPTVLSKTSDEVIPVYKNTKIKELIEKHINFNNLKQQGLPYSIISVILKLHRYPDEDLAKYLDLHGTFPEEYIYALKYCEAFEYIKTQKKLNKPFPSIKIIDNNINSWIETLPFNLTNDQKKVIAEIKDDFLSEMATKRIIVGDVGSGKTMVILASVVLAYPEKSLLMAPTSILAQQLFQEAKKFLPHHFKIGLITSKTVKKVLKENPLDDFDFLIGTQALIYQKLPRAFLIMVDEQHRFGTRERNKLKKLVQEGDKHPHFLQFSATPIPRTQAMMNSLFIKTSLIEEIPFEKNIKTEIIFPRDFTKLLNHINDEVKKNHQVLIIYPLVEESTKINYQSLQEGQEFWLSNFDNVYVTHGKDKNKETVLEEFRDKGSILLSTTVVEVGISLPKLTIIVIVGAERLGLATLHQLRGRVSRTGLEGFCYLFTKSNNEESLERLQQFANIKNGFDIATMDLKNRKSGDISKGTVQSGTIFQWFDISQDKQIVQAIAEDIKQLTNEELNSDSFIQD